MKIKFSLKLKLIVKTKNINKEDIEQLLKFKIERIKKNIRKDRIELVHIKYQGRYYCGEVKVKNEDYICKVVEIIEAEEIDNNFQYEIVKKEE